MRFATLIASLLLGAVAAAPSSSPAIEQQSSPLLAARTEITCEPANGSPTGIILPTAGTKVRAGVPFEFAFCSGAYFKTRSLQLLVGFDNGKGAVNLLAYNVSPGQYHQNLTFNATQAGTGNLVYYTRYGLFRYNVQLNVSKK
ncbi:hypothetical protein OC842_001983 [Tilletia horrida]|uniref:Uncharacterized protein n=1 Tax=Tilletia horrida TaxID=155126 RepID=A0AAN6JSN0_9BASI|nr:hypothetical protein OC842_001983 [Tilletia horrida]